jgi:hypothetical protein
MYYSRATIDNLLGEHIAIRGHLELVVDLTRKWNTLLSSETSLETGTEKRQEVAEKRRGLIQAMGYFEDGLRTHHIHEDEVMPSLVGDLLMKAIRIEHLEMLKLFDKIDAVLINASLEVFLQKGSQVMQWIDDLSGLARAHSSREDGILHFLKRLPEETGVRE